jgi:hypothetical protein
VPCEKNFGRGVYGVQDGKECMRLKMINMKVLFEDLIENLFEKAEKNLNFKSRKNSRMQCMSCGTRNECFRCDYQGYFTSLRMKKIHTRLEHTVHKWQKCVKFTNHLCIICANSLSRNI